jgi:hypothetical protein
LWICIQGPLFQNAEGIPAQSMGCIGNTPDVPPSLIVVGRVYGYQLPAMPMKPSGGMLGSHFLQDFRIKLLNHG